MKKTILIASLFLTLGAFAQTEATTKDGKKVILNKNGTWLYAECASLLKTETVGGKPMTSAKDNIKVSSDGGLTGLSVSLIKGSESVILNFAPLEKDVICVNKNAPMTITFTDGTSLNINHMGTLNCEGNFSVFLGEAMQNSSSLEKLTTKQIKKISIEYTSTEGGVIKKYSKESVVDAATGAKLMQTAQCLSNL